MSVYLYFVDGLLIDTAQSNMARRVLAEVKQLRPHQVLLTHHHEDHSGNAAAIAAACGAGISGHPLTVDKMRRTRPILPYQHLVWGRARGVPMTPLGGLVESERVTLTPIHTPGHSKDHTVYLEAQNGWLFSGDLYLGEKIRFFRSDERIGDQIGSLKKVLARDFDTLFCGHNPVASGAKELLRRKLNYLEDFLGTVAGCRQQGLPTEGIVRRLDNGRDRRVKWVTLGNASFANMVRSAVRCSDGVRVRAQTVPESDNRFLKLSQTDDRG
jgi:glyoxylase-like metal-dependent hydrolase (beta-lactamase superfamily II)